MDKVEQKQQKKNLKETLKQLAQKPAGQRTVSISYKWNPKMKAAADALYEKLIDAGIRVLKDDQDMAAGDALEAFMDLIAHPKVDKAILLIDGDYLKARNCQYEVLQLARL